MVRQWGWTSLPDQTGNGHDGTINGATWVNACPQEDLDGDGVAAWEDCDDSDANFYWMTCTCSATSDMYWLDGILYIRYRGVKLDVCRLWLLLWV